MAREPIPTWYFVLVVVRLGPRFLLVHERKHGQLWYLPAGRVEPGETLIQAAVRETQEEASIPIVLDGVLGVEHSPRPNGTRVRVIYSAHPADDTPPKSKPDEETLNAGWFTIEEMKKLPLRGHEVLQLFQAVEAGAPVYPMSLIAAEGTPLKPMGAR